MYIHPIAVSKFKNLIIGHINEPFHDEELAEHINMGN